MSVEQETKPSTPARQPGVSRIVVGVVLGIALYAVAAVSYVGARSVTGVWAQHLTYTVYALVLVAAALALFEFARRNPLIAMVAAVVMLAVSIIVLLFMGDQVGFMDVEPVTVRTVVQLGARSLVAPLLAAPLMMGWVARR